eukprot:scaffold673174_cov71-Attheya_sp.AAC.1
MSESQNEPNTTSSVMVEGSNSRFDVGDNMSGLKYISGQMQLIEESLDEMISDQLLGSSSTDMALVQSCLKSSVLFTGLLNFMTMTYETLHEKSSFSRDRAWTPLSPN